MKRILAISRLASTDQELYATTRPRRNILHLVLLLVALIAGLGLAAYAVFLQNDERPVLGARPPRPTGPVHLAGDITYHAGAIVRGSRRKKQVSLIFSAHKKADGLEAVQETLQRYGVKGAFFFTGSLYRNSRYHKAIQRLRRQGHYLGAHSDRHILYTRNGRRMLVSKREMHHDISNNYRELRRFGVGKDEAPFFLPPYETHNQTVARWCRDMGLHLINITPGSYTALDWTYPGHHYHSSDRILRSVRRKAANNPRGLNGYIFLIHISTMPARYDKFYHRLDDLIDLLRESGYQVVSLRELLR